MLAVKRFTNTNPVYETSFNIKDSTKSVRGSIQMYHETVDGLILKLRISRLKL